MRNGLALVGNIIGMEKKEGYSETVWEHWLINEKGEKVIGPVSSDVLICEFRNEAVTLCKYIDEKINILDKTMQDITSEKFDYVSNDYGDNDTIAVGNKIGELDDTQDKYKCKYIDAEGKTVMEVPDKYIYAGAFVKIK